MVNNYKLNRVVESIRAVGFEFETVEVEESLYDILAYYHMADIELSSEERAILKQELMKLAEQFEFSEVAFLTMQNPVLAWA